MVTKFRINSLPDSANKNVPPKLIENLLDLLDETSLQKLITAGQAMHQTLRVKDVHKTVWFMMC